MAEFDLILSGGRVLSSQADRVCDVGLKDGRIAALGDLRAATGPRRDVSGRVLTPGGVDVHCHIEQISGMGQMNADTFETGTRSALMGGTTTTVSFAPQQTGKTLQASVADYAQRAGRGAMTDHAFHLIVNDTSIPSFEEDLASVIEAGHRSIKIFTTYNIKLDDAAVLEVLAVAKRAGALVCVHAETDALLTWTRERLLAKGLTAPSYHPVARPRLAEIEAVERMIRFAEFFATPVMLFHISTAEAVEVIRAAKARGAPIWAETCPHYLFMSEDVLDRPGLEGAKWMCSPPQRTDADSTALWQGLAEGTLSIVSSDHAPYRFDETGKLAAGPDATFAELANGLPGLEVRMPLMFDAIIGRGMAKPEDFVRLTATAPATLHGLEGKGDLVEGYDADIVIWERTRRVTFGPDDLHDNVGYNPWEGRTIQGWPETVLLRGEVVVDAGTLTTAPGTGQWIARDKLGAVATNLPAPEFEATL